VGGPRRVLCELGVRPRRLRVELAGGSAAGRSVTSIPVPARPGGGERMAGLANGGEGRSRGGGGGGVLVARRGRSSFRNRCGWGGWPVRVCVRKAPQHGMPCLEGFSAPAVGADACLRPVAGGFVQILRVRRPSGRQAFAQGGQGFGAAGQGAGEAVGGWAASGFSGKKSNSSCRG